jgi:hypothetical protein
VTATIRIDPRFNGPPDSANGGYAAGLIAAAIGESVNVRLIQPVPVASELTVIPSKPGRWELRCDDEIVALATLTDIAIEVPQSVPYIEALGVSKHYAGFGQHAFPQCFVCGPARRHNDGLRIFPGSVPGTGIVAAPWLLEDSLDDGAGKVRPEFIWAALDCPGYFASASPTPALLGELAVHIDRPVHIDEPCVVIGWSIHIDGRKHRVGTALFDEDGERCAIGVATWITLPSAA